MAFEFLLIAMIDGQQPLTIQRYEIPYMCELDALDVSQFVNQNYTELKSDWKRLQENFVEQLTVFNDKWTNLQLPVPENEMKEDEWVNYAELIVKATKDLDQTGTELNLPDLMTDALLVQTHATNLIENQNKRLEPPQSHDFGYLDPNRIEYFCIAAPKQF
jgi:hypothetical protein